MRRDQYYSIGQTAKICDISIQTLRYYDKTGLVKPGYVDTHSGYRFYSTQNLLHIKIIQDMKAMNFSLEEIDHALKQEHMDLVQRMFADKQEEMRRQIQELEQVQAAIARRVEQIDFLQRIGSGMAELDVLIELKTIPDRLVACERGRHVLEMDTYIMLYTELFQRMKTNGLKPSGYIMSVYHENIMTFNRNDTDIEVCIPIESEVRQSGERTVGADFVRVVPGGEYITGMYCGLPNEQSCKHIYGKLQEWIRLNGYRECGSAMEQYLVDMTQMMKADEFIVELQIPVELGS
ncbi:MerR family transcriptional regulator [Paenibacillus kobensis]|uniref:MerR family transcriptional regulator n=1 Tax=Paenibacillus kobensis TaxID=59841 RepID=UPI000FD81155|nr:MerR family transcriptional regulator [Paenibacillus kobensis]